MLRRLIVAALAVALACAVSSVSVSAGARCGGPVVAEYVDTSRVRVVRRPSRVVVACDKRTGRRIALGGSPGHLTEFAGPHALDVRGDYVAWGVILHDDGIDGETVWLPEVRSVRLSAPKIVLKAESQREDTSGKDWAIADVVVSADGAVAWTACRAAHVRPGDSGFADADRCVPTPSEVTVSAKGRQLIELARGAGIQPRSLRRSPSARTFSWREGDATRTAAFPRSPRLRVEQACVSPDTEAIIRGSGFSPGKTVNLGATGTSESTVVRPDGTFKIGLRIGQAMHSNRPTVRRFVVGARESWEPEVAAETVQLVAPTAARATPRAGKAGDVARWRITGLAPSITGLRNGRTVYAHWLYAGRHVASTRFGTMLGPCGTLTTTRRLVPQHIARPGRWRVRFDNRRQFARNSGGYAEASITVTRR